MGPGRGSVAMTMRALIRDHHGARDGGGGSDGQRRADRAAAEAASARSTVRGADVLLVDGTFSKGGEGAADVLLYWRCFFASGAHTDGVDEEEGPWTDVGDHGCARSSGRRRGPSADSGGGGLSCP